MAPAPDTEARDSIECTRMPSLQLADLGCPIAVCSLTGRLAGMSPSARIMLKRAHVSCDSGTPELPRRLWHDLISTPLGQSIDWRPVDDPELCIGVSRYRMEDQWFILLMREISDSKETMVRRMQQQRLEAIGRLIAGIAHDLRAPLASIVFSVSVLSDRCAQLTHQQLRDKLAQIGQAAERQQATIAGLLDFAKIGPPVKVQLSVEETFNRVAALLRPKLREHAIQVSLQVDPDSEHAYGNPLTIEQILVNLVLNAAEVPQTATISLVSSRNASYPDHVDIHVIDDGPGIPIDLQERIFDPFFTTKKEGTGIGLTTAREAALGLGGDLTTKSTDAGAHFILRVPAAASHEEHGG